MNCSSCSKELKPEQINSATNYQFDNALWIGFFGGYGMFVDSAMNTSTQKVIPGSDQEAVLCHECAHALCEANPWLTKLLRPKESHAHTPRYWDDHPWHEAWDSRQEKLF